MKIEIRCPGCHKGFLVEERATGGELICPACLTRIALDPPAETVAEPAIAPMDIEPAATERASRGQPARAAMPDADVICPRCKLHFSTRHAQVPSAGSDVRPTVLVVEDLAYFRQLAVDALAEGYNVRTAASVDAARAALSQGGVDLMLLDLTLDGGNHGLDLLAEFPFKPCPILIFTDSDDEEMLGESWEDLRKLGADDIVKKSMNAGEALVHKVDALLGRTEEEDLVVNTVISRE